MLSIVILIITVFCAVQAIRAPRLLISSIWLAGVSALVALMLYLLGAREVAVIELSVGAGLVTVLFVFAISMAGEDLTPLKSLIPRPVAIALVGVAVVLLGLLVLPLGEQAAVSEAPFSIVLWQDRGADVLVQLVLIFAGVLGVLGILADRKSGETDDMTADAHTEDGAEPPVDESPEAVFEPEKELA